MVPLSYRCERAGILRREPGFDSGWRSFGETLVTQVRGGRWLLATASARHPLEAGMGFLVPPGLRHRVAVVGKAPVDAVFANLHCRVHESRGLFTVLTAPITFDREAGRRIGACNEALIACQARGGIAAAVEASARLAELVGLAVARCPLLATSWDDPGRTRLLPVLRHVQDHLAEPIGRGDLARAAGLSVPHLHTLCLRVFAQAPMAMVRHERMQHARQLLRWSDLPVAAVGRSCGFPDQYHFSRVFSRAEGVPPSRYREALRRQDG